MAVSYIGAGSLGATTNSSLAPARPAGVATDDVLLALLYSSAGNTPSAPSGWTQVATQVASGVSGRATLFRGVQGVASTSSFTGGGSSGFYGVISAWRGVDTSSPLDATTLTNTGSSGDPVASSITTATADAMVVALFTGDDNNEIGSPVTNSTTLSYGGSSYVATTGNDACFAAAHKTKTTAGSVGTVSADQTTSQARENWTAFTVALRAVPDSQEEARTGSSVTGTTTSVTYSTAQDEADEVTPETGVSTSVAVSVQLTAVETADTGVVAAASETVQHNATADTSTGTATTVMFNRDSVALPATGPLFFDFWVIDPATGAYVAPLPDYSSAEVSPVFGEPGAVRIDYPFDGANYALLRDGVTHEQDLEIAVWVGGRKDREMRCLLQESDADVVAEQGLHRFAGHFLEVLLAEMVVLPNPANEKQETVFNAATAGEVVEWLVDAAQAEGYLAGVTTDTFSDTTDSNGVAWGETIGNLILSPGTSYAEVLAELDSIGAAEWDITPARELRLFKWGTRGTDRTVQQPPIILRRGRHITEAARKTSVRDAGTDVLMSGKEGLYTRLSDATAVARRGRKILRYESANNIADTEALSAAAQAQLQVTAAGALELTHGLSFGPDDPLPISDYDLGDWVGSDTGNPEVAFDRLRVKQWSFAEDENGEITGGVSLNYLFVDATERLRRRLNRLISGGAVVGTSEPPGADDGVAPAAPTGVTVDSIAYKQGIDTFATLLVGWAAVTTNSDGTAATDVAGYRVEWRHDADPAGVWNLGADVSGTAASFGGVGSGVDVLVRVAAYDRNGNVGAWSEEVMHLTETDLTPPPVPSTPVASNYLGVLICEWDGLGSAGEAMPIDFSHVEVHMSTSAGFVPDATTVVDRLFAAGRMPVADLPYGVEHFFRLVSVDRTAPTPNKSAPSGTASATPGQVVSDDVFDGAIGSAKLADLAVTTAKINDLAVNDAKIGDLSVGKLTAGTFSASMTLSGIIRTALSGARVEIDNAGVRLYNSGGTATIDLNAATGSALVSGEYRSALSGTRFVINSGGINPDEMRFYPSSGSQYGTITTVTSMSDFFGPQSGLSMKAHSGRGDGFTGVLEAFPDYASMSWGPTAVQAVQHQINMGAPRVHIAAERNSSFALDGDIPAIRFGVGAENSADFEPQSVLEVYTEPGNSARFRSFTMNSGMKFNSGVVSFQQSSGSLCSIQASNVALGSSRNMKRDIQELPIDPLSVIAAAQGRSYEIADRPDPDVSGRPEHLRRIVPRPPTRRHLGLIAEELPELLRVDLPEQDGPGVDLYALVTTVWEGLRLLNAKVEAMTPGPGRP